MGRIDRIVVNCVESLWEGAAETLGAWGQRTNPNRGLRRLITLTGALLLVPVALLAAELPEGGTVSAGDATIQRSGDKLLIEQGGQKLAIDWDSFSIGPDGTVRFDQPGGGSIALNRVTGDQISRIRGELTANGGVFLLNPNGVVFGAEAQVNVGALVASTRGLSSEDFLNGDYTFTGSSSGAVINRGTIRARDGGYVALVAAEIVNTGSITADEGAVLAGAGDRVTLDLGGPVNIEVDRGTLEARIEQGGVVQADGGRIHMTAEAAGDLSSSVINHHGISRARTLETGEDGSIVLKGDMETGTTEVAGTLDASAPDGGDGGFIETSAAKVNIDPDATITTEAPAGETGLWLIDPTDFYIAESGGDMTGEHLGTDLESTDVEINTDGSGGDGDIFVNDTVTWDANTLTLSAHRNIEINEHLDASGGGDLTLKYDQSDSGDGAYVVNATNGYQDTVDADRDYHGKVSLDSGSTFKTQDGTDSTNEVTYTILTDLGAEGSTTGSDLQGMQGNLSGDYVLGADIDAGATSGWNSDEGFAPVGDSANEFTGTFDGLGHTISDLIIKRSSDYQGLFGYTDGATIRNVGLEGGSVNGSSYVGGLVGFNSSGSEVSNSYATGDVTGTYDVGGLVGRNDSSEVSDSYATGSVKGDIRVGGLVGLNYSSSTVSNSYATGSVTGHGAGMDFGYVGGLVGMNSGGSEGSNSSEVSNSYATGSVEGTDDGVGGLVGSNNSSEVSNSYATGRVDGSGDDVGGLVGRNDSSEVSDSYATGSVTGDSNVGGLVGYNEDGTITASFWDMETSGQATSAGGEGKTTDEMGLPSTFSEWDETIWTLSQGDTGEGYETLRPYLTNGTREADRPDTGMLFAGGWGDTDGGGAYTIEDWNQLQSINYVADDGYHFELANALDSESTGYAKRVKDGDGNLVNGEEGWKPIGNDTTNFTGEFDGRDHTISDLIIERPGSRYQGLFGYANDATIRNVGLEGGSVVGDSSVGGLVGRNHSSTVSNSYATGSVTGDNNVGGLMGYNDGVTTVSDSYATGSVEGSGYYVGGLVGSNQGGSCTVSDSYATGSVEGDERVGGLVGFNDYHITVNNSYATGDVTGTDNFVGGLVGLNSFSSEVSNSYATGDVTGSNRVGGLVGYNNYSSDITNAYATGNVTGDSDVGGLVGMNSNDSEVSNSYATGDVTGDSNVGGLMGYNYATITNAYATGDVTGDFVGGLVGWNQETIQNAYATGNVTGDSDVGGLVGHKNGGTISASYWDTETTGQSDGIGSDAESSETDVTGLSTADALDQASYSDFDFDNDWFMVDGDTRPFLRMEHSTTVRNAHQLQLMAMDLDADYELAADIDFTPVLTDESRADVWATSSSTGAGFAPVGNSSNKFTGTFDGLGYTISDLVIDRATTDYVGLFGFADGAQIQNVGLEGGSVTGYRWVGGLVGTNKDGTITNTYATGDVTGYGYHVGGLVGENEYGTITNAYATGDVTGSSHSVGGLVGYNYYGNISDAYATGDVQSDSYVGGLVGQNMSSSSSSSFIENVYATGNVTGDDYYSVGGLMGYSNSTITITASYWDRDTTGQSNGIGTDDNPSATDVTGLSTDAMEDPFTFIDGGWDFSTTWGKSRDGSNSGYMVLKPLDDTAYDYYVRLSEDTSKNYGDVNPDLSGLLDGPGKDNITPNWGSAITQTTDVGDYSYTDNNVLDDPGYTGNEDDYYTGDGSGVTPVGVLTVDDTSKLTIDPRALTVTGSFKAADKIYDGTTDATISEDNLDLDNTVFGDNVALDPTAAFTETGPGQAFPVELISVSTLYGVDAGNYTLDLGGAPTTTASITGSQSGSAENAAISDVSRLATSEFGGQETGDGDTDSRGGPPDQGEPDRRSGSGIRANVEVIATGIRLPDFLNEEEQE